MCRKENRRFFLPEPKDLEEAGYARCPYEVPARGLLTPGVGGKSLNPTLWNGEQKDQEFETSLGDMRPLSQKIKQTNKTFPSKKSKNKKTRVFVSSLSPCPFFLS